MALPFSAAHMAELRRRFLSSLTGEELVRLAASLQDAVAAAAASASAAQVAADGAATPEYVEGALLPYATKGDLLGYVTEDRLSSELADYVTLIAFAAAVSDLATKGYVDGKFAGAYSSGADDSSKVLIGGEYHSVVGGLIMAAPGAP